MSDEEQLQQTVRDRFEDLCRALNMDEGASSEAWKSYEHMSRNFTLEGSELHWLACALYVSCRSSVQTVGTGTTEGNYVSLTRILACSQMSLMEFFNKLKKWQDMAELPLSFRQSTERLERNFTVSAVIFRKYVPIFRSLFRAPSGEPARVHRSRKQRRHPCTVIEVFNFCWVLFIHAKGNFPMISDDLVNSYHLLLCALDLVFTNALLCNTRKDLLNPDFRGLPEDFTTKDYRVSPGPLCFMEQLCELHDGLVLEAKGVKEHFWKPFIKKLFYKRILRGKEDSLTGFLDPMNFGDSYLSLSRVYEEHVLCTGGLDERIFTSEGASEDIGTPGPCLCEAAEPHDGAPYRLHASLTASALKVSTLLTGRKYIQDVGVVSPLSSAMKSVGRLHTLLSGSKQGPSAKLTETLRACARDPSDVINRRLQDMFELLSQRYEDSDADDRWMEKDMAVKYFHLAEALYYRILESIIEREKMILGDADMSCILEQDVFHRSLLACCLEIVIFSYRPPGDFPNVIDIFQLPAYHFYKVIEVLVRSEQGLFREVVKHLNQVEEQVLESLAWTSESPLWDSLCGTTDQVPACQEVMPPQYLEPNDSSRTRGMLNTPSTPGADLSTSSMVKGVSPSPTTLLDRYSSPPTVCRRLFVDPVDGEAGVTSTSGSTGSAPTAATKTSQASLITSIPVGQNVVTMATGTVTANNGQTLTIPLQGIANESGGITFIPFQVSVARQAGTALQPLSSQTPTGTLSVQSAVTKPAAVKAGGGVLRKGSLSLFFRKVYHLASVRLRDLCTRLDISSELRRKIWTCFEYSLVHCPEMMKDRHLDQILMCAVYVMAKVTKEDKSFQNIMKCYRTQPQANSNVYRSVLISGRRRSLSTSDTLKPSTDSVQDPDTDIGSFPARCSSTSLAPQPGSAPATPTDTSDKKPSSVSLGSDKEERGDLIHFYNHVYVKQMRHFALRYSSSSSSAGVESLCPYPTLRTGSPRRMLLSTKHSIFISPHKTGSTPSPTTPRDKIYYYISSSPPNRLQEINSMIRTGETPSRKRSVLLEDETSPKRVCPDSHSALLRRLQDVANDRSSSH